MKVSSFNSGGLYHILVDGVNNVNNYLVDFSNYEHIVKTHQNQPVHGQNQVSDAAKFQVVCIILKI
jgi:hypothetical protein